MGAVSFAYIISCCFIGFMHYFDNRDKWSETEERERDRETDPERDRNTEQR